MKYKLVFLISILLIGLFGSRVEAQNRRVYPFVELSDSAQVSILTSAPWPKEIYAVFGHSAMRVYDPVQNIDYVFNYGVFDFNSSNFIYRFMAGETDYMVAAIDYASYLEEYKSRSIDVFEQQINLTQEEKQTIWDYLLDNIRPENRVYRYNIFYNNCTTKLTDILEHTIDGNIIYPVDNTPQSFRNLVHECIVEQPWIQFGIDLVIGSKADKMITEKEKMFLPIYQMRTLDGATISLTDSVGQLQTKMLVIKKEQVLKNNRLDNEQAKSISFFYTPLFVTILICLSAILISLVGYKRRIAICSIYDFILFSITGTAGCVIFFMMFFSVHPCTGSNWNIVWLNPLQLLAALLFFVKPLRKYVYYYHFINFAVLILFLLVWYLIPQQLEVAFAPLIIAIALRSGAYVREYLKLKKSAV